MKETTVLIISLVGTGGFFLIVLEEYVKAMIYRNLVEHTVYLYIYSVILSTCWGYFYYLTH